MRKYSLEPLAELDGLGNGWSEAAEGVATLFAVFKASKSGKVAEGVMIAAFENRADAEKHIQGRLELCLQRTNQK
jgi:hypothetical protein